MSVSKNYLLEQINRSIAVDKDENRLYHKKDLSYIDKWWLNHNLGHRQVSQVLQEYIDKHNYTKKSLIKYLKKIKGKADKITDDMDKKYDLYNSTNEKMSDRDSFEYAYFDGVSCKVYDFIDIIKGQKYYSKDAYNLTDWIRLGLLKEE